MNFIRQLKKQNAHFSEGMGIALWQEFLKKLYNQEIIGSL